MTKTVVRYTFWHWFGLISAFMLLIAISIFIFRYIQSNQDIKLVAEIEIHKVNTPPFIDFSISEEQKLQMIEKIRQEIPLKEANFEHGKRIFDAVYYNHIKTYVDYLRQFHTYYQIELKNNSEVILTDVSLALKGKGKYLADDNLSDMVFSDYKNTISIPDIPPKNTVSLLIWSETILTDYNILPVKSINISCKEGITKLKYPVKITGIAAWNSINNNYPLVFIISGVLILFVVLIVIFFNLGCRNTTNSEEKDS